MEAETLPCAYKYQAFISYSSRDNVFAKKLHRWLESYRLPAELAKVYGVRNRLGNIFRDDEEISATGSLDKALKKALDQSRTLIVVCSRASVQSKWVIGEINYFLARSPLNHIFIVFPPYEQSPASGIIPAPLLDKEQLAEHEMPEQGFQVHFGSYPKRWCLAKLVAGMLGVGFDQLWQRQLKISRAKWILSFYATVMIASTLVVSIVALKEFQDNVFVKEISQAIGNSRAMASLRLSMLYASYQPMAASRHLRETISNDLHFLAWKPTQEYLSEGSVVVNVDSPEYIVVANVSGDIEVFDKRSGVLLHKRSVSSRVIKKMVYSERDKLLAMVSGSDIHLLNLDGRAFEHSSIAIARDGLDIQFQASRVLIEYDDKSEAVKPKKFVYLYDLKDRKLSNKRFVTIGDRTILDAKNDRIYQYNPLDYLEVLSIKADKIEPYKIVAPGSSQGRLVQIHKERKLGLYVVPNESDFRIRLWDLEMRVLFREIIWQGAAKGKWNMSKDGKIVYGYFDDGSTVAWDIDSGKRIINMPADKEDVLVFLSVDSYDSAYTLHHSGKVKAWQGKENPSHVYETQTNLLEIRALAVDDSRGLAATVSEDRYFRVIDIKKNAPLIEHHLAHPFSEIRFSKNGLYVTTFSYKSVNSWSLEDLTLVSAFSIESNRYYLKVLDVDTRGESVNALLHNDKSNELIIVDTLANRIKEKIPVKTDFDKAFFGVNGEKIVVNYRGETHSDSYISILQKAANAWETVYEGKGLYREYFHTLANVHAYQEGNDIVVSDYISAGVLFVINSSEYPRNIRFSPSGNYIGVSYDSGVVIWDVRKQQLLQKIPADRYWEFRFSNDEQYIVAQALQGGVKVFKVDDADLVVSINAYSTNGFLADDMVALISNEDLFHLVLSYPNKKQLHIWDLTPSNLLSFTGKKGESYLFFLLCSEQVGLLPYKERFLVANNLKYGRFKKFAGVDVCENYLKGNF